MQRSQTVTNDHKRAQTIANHQQRTINHQQTTKNHYKLPANDYNSAENDRRLPPTNNHKRPDRPFF